MAMFKRTKFFFGAVLAIALLLTGFAAHAQIFNVLHQFSAWDSSSRTNLDGAKPLGGLTQGRDGSFYGTTEDGGTNGTGTIFKITPGGGFVVVHTFGAFSSGTNADGAYPVAALTRGPDGTLYGTAGAGGSNGNYGVVFKLTTNDSFALLHTFAYSDGENPGAPLVFASDGNVYGTAALGGTGQNGTLFQITTNGNFQTIYNLTTASAMTPEVYTNSDGSRPYGLTQGSDGNFYGTAQYGGTNGNGTVFQFTTNGSFNVLHTFSVQAISGQNADGAAPQATLTQAPDGGFYGTTPNGGTNAGGTIFRVTAGGGFSTVHSFDYFADGANSDAPLIFSRGGFYATAGDADSGAGTILRVTTNGISTVLYGFSQPDTNSANADGAYPQTGLTLGSDGNLYGVTSSGGTNGTGVVFRLTFPTLSISAAGNLAVLSWPTNQAGFSLQLTTNLTNPVWTNATPFPATVGGQYVVTNSPPGRNTFYELVK